MTSVGTETETDTRPVDRAQTIFDWTRQNSRGLTIAAAAILVAGAAYWFYLRSKQIQQSNAEKALLTAKQSIGANNVALAQNDLQKVYARWESTPAGIQAAMLLAQIDFDGGKAQDGLSILEKAAGKAPSTMQPTILSLQGDGYAQMGKLADAAKKYEAAAAATKYELDKGFQRGKAARAYAAAGDTAKARAIWAELAVDPKAVSMTSEAHIRLGELTVRSAKK